MNKLNLEFRQIRENQKLTQKEFADKLGVSRSVIAKIELGEIEISKKMAEKIINTYPNFVNKIKDFFHTKVNIYELEGKTYENDKELLELTITVTNEITESVNKALKIIHFSHLAGCPIYLTSDDVDLFNSLKSKDFLNKNVLEMNKDSRAEFYNEIIQNSFLKNSIAKSLLSKYLDVFYNSISVKNNATMIELNPELFVKKMHT